MSKSNKRFSSKRIHNVESRSPSSIDGYLDRMISDASEIDSRLMNAAGDLTGKAEPKVWEIIKDIQRKLVEAKRVWE